MPLIEADAKGLEVFGAAYLSQCPVLCKELRDGIDVHGENQKALGFPMDNPKYRVIAKIFKFRLLYGGTKYGFCNDSDFNWISDYPRYWQRVIDNYYTKYTGIASWHERLVRQAMDTGCYTSPTGRTYTYKPYRTKWGTYEWPRTQILNYPVQGFGADLMSIARVSASRRLLNFKGVLFINSVHDSILLDMPTKFVYDVCCILEDVFKDVPKNFEKIFKQPMDLPMSGEIKFGPNWKHMEKFER